MRLTTLNPSTLGPLGYLRSQPPPLIVMQPIQTRLVLIQAPSVDSKDHAFVDEHGKSHVFIEYSRSDGLNHVYGEYSSSGLVHDLVTESKNTFELKYGKNFIKIPNYHPLVKFIPERRVDIVDISRTSIDLILIMMDDHPNHDYYMRFSDHEEEFDKLVIQNLHEISLFANTYNIKFVFDYIEKLLTLTTSFALYKYNVEKYYSRLGETEIKSLANKVLSKSLGLNPQPSIDRLINGGRRNKYWRLISECKRTDSVFYNKLDLFHELLLNDIDREAKYKSNVSIKFTNVYQIINLASEKQPVSLTSKFLKFYLELPTICKFDLKKIQPLLQEFDIYKDIKLPSYLASLVKLNLLVLSMNKYGKTPDRKYVNNRKIDVTEF